MRRPSEKCHMGGAYFSRKSSPHNAMGWWSNQDTSCMKLQWNLYIKDTLSHILNMEVSSSRRLKIHSIMHRKVIVWGLITEAFVLSSIISECLLLEVLLYIKVCVYVHA